jgi:hypothetical protein
VLALRRAAKCTGCCQANAVTQQSALGFERLRSQDVHRETRTESSSVLFHEKIIHSIQSIPDCRYIHVSIKWNRRSNIGVCASVRVSANAHQHKPLRALPTPMLFPPDYLQLVARRFFFSRRLRARQSKDGDGGFPVPISPVVRVSTVQGTRHHAGVKWRVVDAHTESRMCASNGVYEQFTSDFQ